MIALIALVALAILAWLATLGRAKARERAAEADYPPQGQFVTVNGLRVHAVVAGVGPDLVLIHGSSGNARDFTFSFVDAVKDRYRVIAFDRPGLGYTDRLPKGREGLHEQAALLQAAAAALGATRPIVLGQSYGGSVALAWALGRPDHLAALVLVSAPVLPWATPLPRLYRLNSSRLGSILAVPLLTAWVSGRYVRKQIPGIFAPERMPAGYDKAIGAALTLRRESLRANAVQRAALFVEVTAMAPGYPRLTIPVELVHGDRDDTVHPDHSVRFAATVPAAHLTRLPGIGHTPHHSATAEVIAAIDRAALRAGLR